MKTLLNTKINTHKLQFLSDFGALGAQDPGFQNHLSQSNVNVFKPEVFLSPSSSSSPSPSPLNVTFRDLQVNTPVATLTLAICKKMAKI